MAPGSTAGHRPQRTTLYRLVQQHAATFFAKAEDAAGADLPQFVEHEFDAFLECAILVAHGYLQTAAHLVDHAIFHVPVRQWMLPMPIALRLLLAARPQPVAPVLQRAPCGHAVPAQASGHGCRRGRQRGRSRWH